MGFIPKDAKWYVAELVEEIEVQGESLRTIHINQVLIRADNPEEAYEKALRLGAESQISYLNTDGVTVEIRFAGLHSLNVIHDDLEHGAEISYRELHSADSTLAGEWVKAKEGLAVFAPRSPRKTPNYVSQSVMEEVESLMRKPPTTPI